MKKTFAKSKRLKPNVEHRIPLPRELRTGVIEVHADAHIREWRREKTSLVVVVSQKASVLIVEQYREDSAAPLDVSTPELNAAPSTPADG